MSASEKPCLWCGSRKHERKPSWGDKWICVDKKACLERRRAKAAS